MLTLIKNGLTLFYLGGREDVKTLVDLAMMSAGESDIETDRVSCLHTTALGFAPFIFDLNNEIDFNQLMNLCESVWKEIEGNATLPKKLVCPVYSQPPELVASSNCLVSYSYKYRFFFSVPLEAHRSFFCQRRSF